MTTSQAPVDLLKQLIRQHKSSIFLRHSVASEKDLTAVAELLLREVVGPYMILINKLAVAKQNQEASQITKSNLKDFPYITGSSIK